MPFSRAHFPVPSRRIRAPHTAVCLACSGIPIRSWSFIVTALSLDGNSWHPVRSSAAHGSPKRALPCFESPIRDIRLDFISRARVWPGRGNKTTSAKQVQIVVATIAVCDAPTKQACQAVGSDNIRQHGLAATLVGMSCLAKSYRMGMNPYNAVSVVDSAMTLFCSSPAFATKQTACRRLAGRDRRRRITAQSLLKKRSEASVLCHDVCDVVASRTPTRGMTMF
jgi:hypothetical protein